MACLDSSLSFTPNSLPLRMQAMKVWHGCSNVGASRDSKRLWGSWSLKGTNKAWKRPSLAPRNEAEPDTLGRITDNEVVAIPGFTYQQATLRHLLSQPAGHDHLQQYSDGCMLCSRKSGCFEAEADARCGQRTAWLGCCNGMPFLSTGWFRVTQQQLFRDLRSMKPCSSLGVKSMSRNSVCHWQVQSSWWWFLRVSAWNGVFID